MGSNHPPAVGLTGVNSHYNKLASTTGSYGRDKIGIGNCRAVDRDFVGAGVEQPGGIVDRSYAAPTVKGMLMRVAICPTRSVKVRRPSADALMSR